MPQVVTNFGNGTTPSVSYPEGLPAGRRLIFFVSHRNFDAVDFETPAGLTLVSRTTPNNSSYNIYQRLSDGNENEATVTFSQDGTSESGDWRATIYIDETDGIVLGQESAAAGENPSSPDIELETPARVLVVAQCRDGRGTWEFPSGLDSDFFISDDNDSNTGRPHIAIGYVDELDAEPGIVGPWQWTISEGTSSPTHSIAISRDSTPRPGVRSDILKEPNESDENVASSSSVTVRVWHADSISGAPDETLSNKVISAARLEFEVDGPDIDDPVSYQAKWTVGGEDRFFEVEDATVIDLEDD